MSHDRHQGLLSKTRFILMSSFSTNSFQKKTQLQRRQIETTRTRQQSDLFKCQSTENKFPTFRLFSLWERPVSAISCLSQYLQCGSIFQAATKSDVRESIVKDRVKMQRKTKTRRKTNLEPVTETFLFQKTSPFWLFYRKEGCCTLHLHDCSESFTWVRLFLLAEDI